jgi:hypothetical protein
MRLSRTTRRILLIAVAIVLLLAALAAYWLWMLAQTGPPIPLSERVRIAVRETFINVVPGARAGTP